MAGTVKPPYLRIVAEIRRRVAEGELSPGDRVPSTRRLAREWGVALATATRALQTLRQQGVVQAQPRIGSVVAATRPAGPTNDPAGEPTGEPAREPTSEAAQGATSGAAPRPTGRGGPRAAGASRTGVGSEHELSRDRVVRAAIAIVDAEGLEALSMRAVAARLGVATMSPYRHVGGKEDLVLLMADAAFGELGYPDEAPPDWRPRLELAARTLWALHRRHPWLAQLGPLSRPLPLPNLLVHSEWILDALDGHGLDAITTFELDVVLYSYVQGLAVHLEREAHATASTGLSEEQWMAEQAPALGAIAATGRYPAFTRILAGFGRDGYDFDLDRLFERGLRSLLDGFAVLLR